MCSLHASTGSVAPTPRRGARLAVGGGALATAGLAGALAAWLSFGPGFVGAAAALYLPAAALVAAGAAQHHPHARFGLANLVTLLRLVVACLFAGLAVELAMGRWVTPAVLWGFAGLAVLAVTLDGADGYLARRQALASDFGARFDHEVDTLLLVLLSVLAFLLGKAGLWVLLIGTMRYLFVAAGWLWAPLRRPLPPSYRRSAVCVVEAVVLVGLLLPVVTPPASAILAAAALTLLSLSFAADVIWLARRRRSAREGSAS